MTRRSYLVLFLCAAFTGAALYRGGMAGAGGQLATGQPDAGDPAESPAGKLILGNVQAYVDAFNRQDVKAILELFTEDCDVTEPDGTQVRGREELGEELKETFASEPTARIGVEVASLTFVAPNVAVEVGKTNFYPDGKTLTAESEYQVTHVSDGKRWLMSHVRGFNRETVSPYDQLRDLEWLVGDWVDEGGDSLIESSYRWDANKSFLLQKFTVRVKGQQVLSGTQRIGWDPLSKKIKAWVFDSEGGYGDSLWTPIDDGWLININAVRSDGKIVTATNQLTPVAKDRIRFESVDRLVGDEQMPGFVTFVVRRPPPAGK